MTPDVNLLVAASRSDHSHHAAAYTALTTARQEAAKGHRLGLLGTVVASFLRLVTHPKVFGSPTPTAQALAFVDVLLVSPGVSMLPAGDEWSHLRRLCVEGQLTANDLPDAWIAASVLQHDEVLVTFDKDFLRLLPPTHLHLLRH